MNLDPIQPNNVSGLKKSITTLGAIVFGIHCISLSSSGFIPFSWVASSWPGASIIGVLSIAALLSMLHGYTFAAIGSVMPRSGSDYVLASRFLSPFAAFLSSWTLIIFSGVVAGGLIAWIPKSAFPALFQPLAIIFDKPELSEFSNYAASTRGVLVIGLILLVVTTLTTFLPSKVLIRFMSFGLLLGILAWLVIYYSLLSGNDASSFVEGWNRFVGPTSSYGAYSERLPLAQSAGMTISSDTTTMTLAGLIMGFWIYYGYYIPTFFSGEVQKAGASRALLTASLAAIGISWAIFTLGAYLLQRLLPLDWIAAEGYLSNNGDAVKKIAGAEVPAYPWITFYAAILKPNPGLVMFTAFAWIYTLINLVQTYFFYGSRVILAWALDGMVPAAFRKVDVRTATPRNAILVFAVLAAVGVIDAASGGPISTQLTFTFFAVVTQIVPVIAIAIFPYRMPKQWRLCPGFVRATLFSVPVVTIIGVFTLVYLLWLVTASFLFPAVGVSRPTRTLLLLSILLVTGTVVYVIAVYRSRKSGRPSVFDSIPGE
jgi:basic amino acid/polyamine antiporter, APA family